ncbi:MAG: hypothetical protein K2Q45_05440 [Nitrosomonas sp.]|nr:hypothetical protein [Nitrosomonas sp.]
MNGVVFKILIPACSGLAFVMVYHTIEYSYERDLLVTEKLNRTKKQALFVDKKTNASESPAGIVLQRRMDEIGYYRVRISMRQVLSNISLYEKYVAKCKKRNWLVRLFETVDPYDSYLELVINRITCESLNHYNKAEVAVLKSYEVENLLEGASYDLKN